MKWFEMIWTYDMRWWDMQPTSNDMGCVWQWAMGDWPPIYGYQNNREHDLEPVDGMVFCPKFSDKKVSSLRPPRDSFPCKRAVQTSWNHRHRQGPSFVFVSLEIRVTGSEFSQRQCAVLSIQFLVWTETWNSPVDAGSLTEAANSSGTSSSGATMPYVPGLNLVMHSRAN